MAKTREVKKGWRCPDCKGKGKKPMPLLGGHTRCTMCEGAGGLSEERLAHLIEKQREHVADEERKLQGAREWLSKLEALR